MASSRVKMTVCARRSGGGVRARSAPGGSGKKLVNGGRGGERESVRVAATAMVEVGEEGGGGEDGGVAVRVKRFADGAVVGDALLDVATAGMNARSLVHKYVVHVQQNMRRGTASTKTRAEVRGGGKKPYSQKGTGRARQGSSRTPLRPGGGVIFGPKPRDWSSKMNKKERWLALSSALRNAAASTAGSGDDGASTSVFVLESLESQFKDDQSDVKTKVMEARLRALGVEEGEKALIIAHTGLPEEIARSGRNLPWLTFNTVRSGIHVTDVLQADKIFFDSDAFAYVNARFGAAAPEDLVDIVEMEETVKEEEKEDEEPAAEE